MQKLAALILASAVLGAGLVVAGVYLLAGAGWALICGGSLLFVAAAVLRNGLRVANG